MEDPDDDTRQIPNPGFSISAIVEERLKLACYGARIYRMLGRPITLNLTKRVTVGHNIKQHFSLVLIGLRKTRQNFLMMLVRNNTCVKLAFYNGL